MGSCLMDMLASVWVDFYHAAFVSKKTLDQENEQLRMCAVQKELDSCYRKLSLREAEMQERALSLAENAVAYKRAKNMPAAKKKMLERARVVSQLEKVQNSIAMIDMHRSTFEGAALDISVFETLKASGDALRQLGATSQGLSAVEDVVADVESSMRHAADITSVLSSGSVTGMVNTMSTYGTVIDEDELMKELQSMEDDMNLAGPAAAAASSSSSSYYEQPTLMSSIVGSGGGGVNNTSKAAVTGSSTINSILRMPSISEEHQQGRVSSSSDGFEPMMMVV